MGFIGENFDCPRVQLPLHRLLTSSPATCSRMTIVGHVLSATNFGCVESPTVKPSTFNQITQLIANELQNFDRPRTVPFHFVFEVREVSGSAAKKVECNALQLGRFIKPGVIQNSVALERDLANERVAEKGRGQCQLTMTVSPSELSALTCLLPDPIPSRSRVIFICGSKRALSVTGILQHVPNPT